MECPALHLRLDSSLRKSIQITLTIWLPAAWDNSIPSELATLTQDQDRIDSQARFTLPNSFHGSC
jgi:hypothetical protein